MSYSWTIQMAAYPRGFENALLLVATFHGMALVVVDAQHEGAFHTVMLEADEGTCPVQVTAASFAAVAACHAGTQRPKPLIVLQRRDATKAFSFIQFVDADEAGVLLNQLERNASS